MKEHPELYAKENVHYVDKGRKDSLWTQIGDQIDRTGPDVQRWFQTQRTRYGKLTADLRKSGSGTGKKFQMTGRATWCLQHFKFLEGHIMRKAAFQTAGFSSSSATGMTSPTKPDESRGSGTDVEGMDTSGQALSRQPSFSAATTSTPSQSQDSAYMDLYRQTQSLLSDFLKQGQSRTANASPSTTSWRQRPTSFLMQPMTAFKPRCSTSYRSTSVHRLLLHLRSSIRDFLYLLGQPLSPRTRRERAFCHQCHLRGVTRDRVKSPLQLLQYFS